MEPQLVDLKPAPPTGWHLALAIEALRHQLVTDVDEDLAPISGSFAQMRALALMDTCGHMMHAAALGRYMGTSRQAGHAMLQRLARDGLVQLMHEGWAIGAFLTEEGADRLRAFMEAGCWSLERLESLPDLGRRRLLALVKEANIALQVSKPDGGGLKAWSDN